MAFLLYRSLVIRDTSAAGSIRDPRQFPQEIHETRLPNEQPSDFPTTISFPFNSH